MTRIKSILRPSAVALAGIFSGLALSPSALANQQFRHVEIPAAVSNDNTSATATPADSAARLAREVTEILADLGEPEVNPAPVNKIIGPWVFLGYRNLTRKGFDTTLPSFIPGTRVMTGDSIPDALYGLPDVLGVLPVENDSTDIILDELARLSGIPEDRQHIDVTDPEKVTPKWLVDALNAYRIQEDFMYRNMIENPATIDYAYWDLPVPPRLLDDDVSFAGYMRRLDLPDVDVDKAVLPEELVRRRHWLHSVGASLHFSQAFVSDNWYQGGNNHLALLFGFNWNVQLNQVFHPDILFQSNLSYKLGLNSTPQDEVHAYSISEDMLQYNLNTGLKAFKKWFYSFNAVFKTQILRNYEKNSMVRTASFLSPGDLNLGLGMAYSHKNRNNTIQLTATISPLSYNLKTCITDKIDHSQFNISPTSKTRNEIGSNGEFNMSWIITANINYKTRVFLFTDYKYFLSDWENTINFDINRFLSTQLYVHLRYDTSTEGNTSWKHLQLRELLSFGLTYTFSTKP